MMRDWGQHLSDQELVLAADGELSGERQRHLADCQICQARQRTLEDAAGLVRADVVLPAAGPARTRLRARLAEIAEQPPARHLWFQPWHAAAVGTLALVCIAGILTHGRRAFEVPSPRLTPGAARTVDRQAICNSPLPKNRVVPADLRQRVFQAYGIVDADPRKYEVDYLITPALGGADDIRNLWPQPYESTIWNARLKDELEDRLHDLVCGGRLDLAEAQRAISTDWIAAYKKYVETR
jgi:hypothetical protein